MRLLKEDKLLNENGVDKGCDIPNGQPILSLDFDGVIHSYESRWQGATNIPDPPVEGVLPWLVKIVKSGKLKVVIFSSRANYEGGVEAMSQWLADYCITPDILGKIQFVRQKPPAHLHIDDRAMLFTGQFPTEEEILKFKPWNKK